MNPPRTWTPENERLLEMALDTLGQGRTLVVIAHRLATAMRADQVVVLEAGRVVATGTHADLLARCDLYARMVEAYASG